jgi:photosystem II stability/assembly factor-like uncharacterized protein
MKRAAMLAAGLLTGCHYCSFGPPGENESVDLGIDTDLHALVQLGDSYLAVGDDGTVVTWSAAFSGDTHEPIVEVFDLGDADLHAVWIDNASWWVVGDGALLMASHDRGATWDDVDLQITADLHGIAGFAGRPIVVGDDTIALRTVDGTWTVLEPPAGGWGQLRSIWADDALVLAVGLDGVIWSTSDPSGTWTLEPSGVTTDLFAVEGQVAVGAEGTLLRRHESGWTRDDTGVDVDLVDYENYKVLGANGEIYNPSEPLDLPR